MKITRVKPFYFRAFGDNPQIDFNDELTIFYGTNGSGKSSLSEALEWLLYGFTKRRRKGDEYSKNEYKGSYVNTDCPKGVAPYVEIELITSQGNKHIIRREITLNKNGLPIDNESVITIDGKVVDNFSLIGLVYSEANCPVIVQHGIQDFIHTRPIDRYRVLSDALGVSDLIAFKDILEKTKNYRRSNPPSNIIQAKSIIRNYPTSLRGIGLISLAEKWEAEIYTPENDYAELLSKACELANVNSTEPEIIIQALRDRRAEEITKVFDISPFRPSLNLIDTVNQSNISLNEVEQVGVNLNTKLVNFTNLIVSQYHTLLIDFLTKGLHLLDPNHPENCPLCGQATLTNARKTEIEKNIEQGEAYSKSRNELDNEISEYIKLLTKVAAFISQISLSRITDEHEQSLQKLFQADKTRLESFIFGNRIYVEKIGNLQSSIINAKKIIEGLRDNINNTDKFLEYAKQINIILDLTQKVRSAMNQDAVEYNKSFNEFRPVFERELSDEATVAKYTELIDILINFKSIKILARAKAIDNEFLEAQRVTDEYILQKQKSVLTSREADILRWYGLLSPNQDVKFSGLEPGRNEFSLKAESFGRKMNAAASLSQSQLNCLGLSIYISSVTDLSSPFRFIFFDDPVQAMDDDHHESFLVNIVPELKKHGFQIIILTHIKETADRLREINYTSDFAYFRFDKLQATGPVVVEHAILSNDIKKIKQFAQGNEENREMAVDRIRVLCENIIREAYLKSFSIRIPVPHNRATASSLMPFFTKTPNVTPAIVTELQDTITWSNPAHHTQPGYTIPNESNIKPHIERLERIIKTLGLLKP